MEMAGAREKERQQQWFVCNNPLLRLLAFQTFFSMICCNLFAHLLVNHATMVTQVAFSRPEIAEGVTLTQTTAHSCINLSFSLSLFQSIRYLDQLPLCLPPGPLSYQTEEELEPSSSKTAKNGSSSGSHTHTQTQLCVK